MIIQFIEKLNSKSIILASASPRRQEILKNIGLQFSVLPSTFEENLKDEDFDNLKDYVLATAEAKADEVCDRLSATCTISSAPDLIISCDTIVTQDGKVYGKPCDDGHASQMLRRWSGSSHEVISGVCVLHRLDAAADGCGAAPAGGVTWGRLVFTETTSVTFATLTEKEVQAYVATGEPRDKAGAYGIQGIGGCLVESIRGCYFNVMGFPLHHFCKQILSIMDAPLTR